MKKRTALSVSDLSPPTREDILAVMADLKQAYENDPTLDRGWMVEMSKYIFHIVGDWQKQVTESNNDLLERVEHCENAMRGIYDEMRNRMNNQEQSVRLCLSVANRFFAGEVVHKTVEKPILKEDINGKAITGTEG